MSEVLTGRVIKVINDYEIVIDKGSNDEVKSAYRFLVYRLDDEIFDPATHESLGRLEIVCGEGKPKHIQERFTTIESCQKRITGKRRIVTKKQNTSLYTAVFPGNPEETTIYEPESEIAPFEYIDTDCLFKQI
ncbi:MAG: hypothetical protein IJS42_03350 [Synergistaceae bacterium]|nr:hypothetical protein [Synergistaceae bacterium]